MRKRNAHAPVRVSSALQREFPQMDRRATEVLINLIRNAVDASLETGGGVRINCDCPAGSLDIIVQDDGPGLPNTTNLFVPFFTTKPGGSGIGLVLSRQIAEAHGGSLTLQNRKDVTGCEARLRLRI